MGHDERGDEDQGFRDRLSKQSEEALGRIAEELASNPVVAGALGRAFQAREKAAQAQEVAMGALGIPSAADVERLTRRLRSLSQRLEGIEDMLDRLEDRLDGAATAAGGGIDDRTARLEARLEEVARDVAAVREAIAPREDLPPRAQERLTVTPPSGDEPAPARAAQRTARRGRAGRRSPRRRA